MESENNVQLKFNIALIKKYEKLKDRVVVYETVLAQENLGFWDMDLKNNLVCASKSMKKLLGYDEHDLTGISNFWEKIIHVDDLLLVLNQLAIHIESKGDIPFKINAKHYHKNGEILPMNVIGQILSFDNAGFPVRMIISLKNLSASIGREINLAHLETDPEEPLEDSNEHNLNKHSIGGEGFEFSDIKAKIEEVRLSEGSEFLGELLRIFNRNIVIDYDEFRWQFKNKNYAEVANKAHKMAGSFIVLKFVSEYNLALNLSHDIKENNLLEIDGNCMLLIKAIENIMSITRKIKV